MKKLIAALTFIPFVAHAEFMDGNNLYKLARSDNQSENIAAIAYIMGVADAHYGINYCPPDNVKSLQLFDLTRQFLEQNPANRNHSADAIVLHVIKTVWPCNNRPARGNSV